MKKSIFSAISPFFITLYILLWTVLFQVLVPFSPTMQTKATAQEQSDSSLLETLPQTPTVGSYACILSDSTFFYSLPDERRGVFLLPKTYYVRLLEYRSDYCKIEYQLDDVLSQRLTGYARTSELTFVNYTPLRPYLSYTFEVRYRIEDGTIEDSDFLNELTVTCVYYGDYRIGSETYCYVLRGDTFGYIPKPTSLSFEENSEYADYLASLQPPDSSTTEPKEEDSPSSPAQIAILIALCLLVPVLAALIIKPPKRPPYETDDSY